MIMNTNDSRFCNLFHLYSGSKKCDDQAGAAILRGPVSSSRDTSGANVKLAGHIPTKREGCSKTNTKEEAK